MQTRAAGINPMAKRCGVRAPQSLAHRASDLSTTTIPILASMARDAALEDNRSRLSGERLLPHLVNKSTFERMADRVSLFGVSTFTKYMSS